MSLVTGGSERIPPSERPDRPTHEHRAHNSANGHPQNGHQNEHKPGPELPRVGTYKPYLGEPKAEEPRFGRFDFRVKKDIRRWVPRPLQRFTGYRPPGVEAPFAPLPFPPFCWLPYIPLEVEVVTFSALGAIISVLLIEIVMSSGVFADSGTPIIIASLGASATLCFGTIESPLAQPRHVFGGHVLSAILGVCITKLFRTNPTQYTPVPGESTTTKGGLGTLAWVSGGISVGTALVGMEITGTVHPPWVDLLLFNGYRPFEPDVSLTCIEVERRHSLLQLNKTLSNFLGGSFTSLLSRPY